MLNYYLKVEISSEDFLYINCKTSICKKVKGEEIVLDSYIYSVNKKKLDLIRDIKETRINDIKNEEEKIKIVTEYLNTLLIKKHNLLLVCEENKNQFPIYTDLDVDQLINTYLPSLTGFEKANVKLIINKLFLSTISKYLDLNKLVISVRKHIHTQIKDLGEKIRLNKSNKMDYLSKAKLSEKEAKTVNLYILNFENNYKMRGLVKANGIIKKYLNNNFSES